jgi:hypothetical protein
MPQVAPAWKGASIKPSGFTLGSTDDEPLKKGGESRHLIERSVGRKVGGLSRHGEQALADFVPGDGACPGLQRLF